MKYLIKTCLVVYVLFAIGLASCVSSKKHLARGNYDKAITKSAKKLHKKPFNEKHILIIEEAYKKANLRDEERINYLKKEGTPDIWDEIFGIYSSMDRRQNIVKALPRLVHKSQKRTIYFDLKNYDEEKIAAKQKAAEYFYMHGKQMLDQGGKYNAREAYGDFMNVKSLYKDFKDVEQLVSRAKNEGTSYVLFKMDNRSGMIMPAQLEDEILKLSVKDLDRKWTVYHNRATDQINYEYSILVNIKEIYISPESVKESKFQESREIEDGWKYLLDEKGNVKKDTSGKDIKVPKYVLITCDVFETFQQKTSRIRGSIDYMNNRNGQLLKSDPIMADGIFENISCVAVGNINALKPETKKRVGGGPVPFPNNAEMVLRTSDQLKNMVKNIVWANVSLVD